MEGIAVFGRIFVGGLTAAMLIGSPSLEAQLGKRPLAPLPANGLRVAPFFDGFYKNEDGTVTLSFGFSNLNLTEVIEIPHGPDNFIAPAEFDGRQPTVFEPPGARAEEPPTRRQRNRGVFTVTVPADFRDDVVWTLVNQERSFSVPANAQSSAYQLQWPMAMGSQPPLVRFSPDGPAGRGPTGIDAEPLSASVDTPISLSVWIHDDSVREEEPVAVRRRRADPDEPIPALNVTWFKHTGPGSVVFSSHTEPIAETEGMATTTVTFDQPGDYLIRVRADNFGRVDSTPGDQCCWTNGYVKVTVTS